MKLQYTIFRVNTTFRKRRSIYRSHSSNSEAMHWGSTQWKGHVAKSKVWQEHMHSLYFSPVIKALHGCDYTAGFPEDAGTVCWNIKASTGKPSRQWSASQKLQTWRRIQNEQSLAAHILFHSFSNGPFLLDSTTLLWQKFWRIVYYLCTETWIVNG